VNAFGRQTCDETSSGLHPFASSRLKVGNVSRHGARRVFLTQRAEINPGRFPHPLFQVVEGKGAVAVDGVLPWGKSTLKTGRAETSAVEPGARTLSTGSARAVTNRESFTP
jgi:hypothetical protein